MLSLRGPNYSDVRCPKKVVKLNHSFTEGIPELAVAQFTDAYTSVHRHASMCSLQWRHNGHDSVSNHQPHDCLLNRLFRRRSKKVSKLRVTGLCARNSPGTGEFPAQMASHAENVSTWWRHHERSHGRLDYELAPYICDKLLWLVTHLAQTYVSQGQKLVNSMMTSSNGNIFHVTGHLCGEFIR